jgi:glycosyltransferase involved in cell wall biosynthesis
VSAPLLTAAMIVRDEAQYLPGCLASLQGLADELVIVDTGSRDDTVNIARRHGATVLHHPWNQDFSAARNHGLDHCHGRWILCIDADERLRPLPRAQLTNLLQNAPEPALLVRFHVFVGATPSLEYRLWRNDPRIRFSGAVHNRVKDAIRRVAADDGQPIGACELTIDHLGFEVDQTGKHRRNISLLRAQLAREPGEIFNWCHLSRALRATGETDEADRALERALALGRGRSDYESALAWGELVRVRLERDDDVAELLAEGRARWPDNWWLVWVESHRQITAGRHEEAIAGLRRLLEVDPTLPQPLIYDERIFGSFAQAALGLALFRSERYAEAADAYRAAERLEPGVAEYRVKRQLAEARAG